ncbi:hypothetical protein FACS18949_13610 [Clostridia bacterium]|nr:hypothetical protein FACS18949_13610 [Clostridia bacterium]
MKRLFAACIALALIASAAAPAFAAIPYKTWTRTPGQGLTETQTAYEPLETLRKVGAESLKAPSDMRLGADGCLYIADTGNKRVVVSTPDGELVKVLGAGLLKIPKGLCVTDDGLLYVADEGLESVVVLNADDEIIREYKRPNHPLFGEYSQYKPQKVAVDKRGNLYVASKGNTNGIIQLAAGDEGEFLGYFGANITNVNLMTVFRSMFYNEEQMSRLADVMPITVTNLSIDGQGLIYTVSQGDQNAPLKKLNVAGRNIIDVSVGDSLFSCVTTGATGNIFSATRDGFIYEYNSEGELIFIFGGPDDGLNRVGLFKAVSGIAVTGDDRVYVLDEDAGVIQVFAPTEFADTVHYAFKLFDEGRYIESKEPWQDIVKMNSLFAYANTGLGEASYREREYAEALSAFRKANNRRGYSDSFWELRSNWLSEHLAFIIVAAVLLLVLWRLVKFFDRRYAILAPARRAKTRLGNVKLLSQTLFAFRNITNPADAAYGLKREGKAGWRSSFILLGVFWLLFVIEKYFSGFLFKYIPDGYYDLAGDLFTVLGVFALSVISCYLVCTITEGEASFKELFAGIIYAFAPIFALKPAVIILTNVLTQGEDFFITLLNVAAYAWSGILVFLAVKNLNDYTFGKTIKTVLLTIFVALIMALLLFIVYVLISQVLDFVSSIFGEAVFKLAEK